MKQMIWKEKEEFYENLEGNSLRGNRYSEKAIRRRPGKKAHYGYGNNKRCGGICEESCTFGGPGGDYRAGIRTVPSEKGCVYD